jgi:hypothetical protein
MFSLSIHGIFLSENNSDYSILFQVSGHAKERGVVTYAHLILSDFISSETTIGRN